jgi:hypothetical protein
VTQVQVASNFNSTEAAAGNSASASVAEATEINVNKTSDSDMPAIIPTEGMIDLGGEDESDSIGIENDEAKNKKEEAI